MKTRTYAVRILFETAVPVLCADDAEDALVEMELARVNALHMIVTGSARPTSVEVTRISPATKGPMHMKQHALIPSGQSKINYAYPLDTPDEVDRAREALRTAGLEKTNIFLGDPGLAEGEAQPYGTLWADPEAGPGGSPTGLDDDKVET